jgi:hypothetical protein
LAIAFRSFVLAAAIPAAWMLIQVVPLPLASLLHPIWLSTYDTLNDPSLGSLTIDACLMLIAIIQYLAISSLYLPR